MTKQRRSYSPTQCLQYSSEQRLCPAKQTIRRNTSPSCSKVKRDIMIPVPKVSIHDVLAREWMRDFMNKKTLPPFAVFSAFSAAFSAEWPLQRRTLSLRLPRPAARKRFKNPNRQAPGRQTPCLWIDHPAGRQLFLLAQVSEIAAQQRERQHGAD